MKFFFLGIHKFYEFSHFLSEFRCFKYYLLLFIILYLLLYKQLKILT